MSGHRVGVVVYDGVKLLDVAGPMEVFAEANRIGGTRYELLTIGSGEVTSSTGLAISVDTDATAHVDTVLVAGADHLVGYPIEPPLVELVHTLAERTPRVCSICTGAFILAAAGVLDGKRATTHWQHARLLAARYPKITVEPDAIWVQDGRVFTSAGVSAGIDLALALVEKDTGGELARAVARSLVVFLQRPGGQSQFSPSTSHPRPRSDVLRAVIDAVAANPGDDHSIAKMAATAAVSPRHLTRLFRAELDEAGQGLRPPKGRTWGRRGQTPIVRVTGRGSGRVSIAGLVCLKPGQRPRLIYRTRIFRGRKHEPKGFAEADYIALLDQAHQRLGGNLVLVWDRLNTHLSVAMRRMIAARSWLTVFLLPTYASDLNPVEGVWSLLKRSLADLAKRTIDQLAAIIKSRLTRMQYRPDLITSLVAKTGLDLRPP